MLTSSAPSPNYLVASLWWVPESLAQNTPACLALLDIEVTLIDQKPGMLDFVDREIAEALSYHMRDIGVIPRFGEEVVSISKTPNGKVRTTLRTLPFGLLRH